MPPDEYHQRVNNSVYTNTVAKLSLLLPKYVNPLINRKVYPQYEYVANMMYIPFNQTHNWHPEYDNYKQGKR